METFKNKYNYQYKTKLLKDNDGVISDMTIRAYYDYNPSDLVKVDNTIAFSSLTDISSSSLTVDKIYLQAITRLNVTANGGSSYSFDQYSTNNPNLYAISWTTIAFNLNVIGHPFLIRNSSGVNYNDGLVHVSTTGTVLNGVFAQGQVTGTLYWKIPQDIKGNYQYICSIHSNIIGVITVKDISVI